MKNPLVSIVILNYNGKNDLEECFKSLYNLDYPNFEMILVDNNSQDNSVQIIRHKYKKVKIIELKKNYGFAKGNNLGIPYTQGKYIVLLNMDTIVDKNWLKELVKVAQLSKKIGIVGSKIYYYDEQTIIDYAGSTCDKYGNTSHIGTLKRDSKLLNEERKTFYACGASLLIKRILYNQIKLFDPIYFAYYEDVDLCWRAWICGYDVFYAPKSYIYHKIGRVIKDEKRKVELTERNKLRTLLKNYQLITLIKVILGYYRRVLNRILYLSKNYRRQFAAQFVLSTFKALSWNLFHIKSLILQRKKISKSRKRSDKIIMKLMKELENYAKFTK